MNNVKERPIILNAQEVNAVLVGAKTQHRVPALTNEQVKEGFEWSMGGSGGDNAIFIKGVDIERSELLVKPCPLGAIGDRLWVQEEHRPVNWSFDDGEVTIEYRDCTTKTPHYLTDEEFDKNPNDDYPFAVVDELLDRNIPMQVGRDCFDFSNPENLPHWRTADVMPQFASRLLLEITDIRIERVQDITHNNSVKEAAFTFYPKQAVPPLSAFPRYWMEKHGDDAWRLNPWVWVIEFKAIKEGDCE